MKRDWSEANERWRGDGHAVCLLCAFDSDCGGPIELAHLIGREHDEPHPTRTGWLIVRWVDVVPLCRVHHRLYDARQLSILPYLGKHQQARAVNLVGLVAAYRRLAAIPKEVVL